MISTTTEWGTATLSEAGFAPDVEERFEVAREAGVLPNLHGVVAARNGRIFFERYLAGLDAALARPLAWSDWTGHAARHALGYEKHRRATVWNCPCHWMRADTGGEARQAVHGYPRP